MGRGRNKPLPLFPVFPGSKVNGDVGPTAFVGITPKEKSEWLPGSRMIRLFANPGQFMLVRIWKITEHVWTIAPWLSYRSDINQKACRGSKLRYFVAERWAKGVTMEPSSGHRIPYVVRTNGAWPA